jgi:hypothetical protein
MKVIDATVIDDPEDADEVLACYLSYAIDGDKVSIHHPFCRTQLGAREECTCTPKILVVGARA